MGQRFCTCAHYENSLSFLTNSLNFCHAISFINNPSGRFSLPPICWKVARFLSAHGKFLLLFVAYKNTIKKTYHNSAGGVAFKIDLQ